MRLSDAQQRALFHISEGYYEMVRSGRHLAVLFERGLIERGQDCRYVLTEAGKVALASTNHGEPAK